MKNIHILPTDKPSRLAILNSGKLNFGAEFISSSNSKAQNIYITSDEMVKVNDYMTDGIWVDKVRDLLNHPKNLLKKIILTTDVDLIKDGVQKIDDDFLEWFVKNQSCEFVKIEVDLSKHNGQFQTKYGYKIIIPKEEPKQDFIFSQLEVGKEYKQEVFELGEELERGITITYVDKQETVEEAAEKYQMENGGAYSMGLDDAFYNGAKWQQERSYSEDDMIDFAYNYTEERKNKGARAMTPELLIKQFKNK